MGTATGQVVSRAIDLDADIDCHIAPNLDEVPARVFAALRLLRTEKVRYQNEQQERDNGRTPIHNRR